MLEMEEQTRYVYCGQKKTKGKTQRGRTTTRGIYVGDKETHIDTKTKTTGNKRGARVRGRTKTFRLVTLCRALFSTPSATTKHSFVVILINRSTTP